MYIVAIEKWLLTPLSNHEQINKEVDMNVKTSAEKE